MKLGVTDFPPLTFRTISMWLGLPVLALAMVWMKVPFYIPRERYGELLWLSVVNMFGKRPANTPCLFNNYRGSGTQR